MGKQRRRDREACRCQRITKPIRQGGGERPEKVGNQLHFKRGERRKKNKDYLLGDDERDKKRGARHYTGAKIRKAAPGEGKEKKG